MVRTVAEEASESAAKGGGRAAQARQPRWAVATVAASHQLHAAALHNLANLKGTDASAQHLA